ncbi:MAG TPA: mechanosensitive ion channel domain-containing protein [Steroidobacteraceae bacterium]|jgi:small-conductance mechanosensitive channel|nr:mechanosensitive ion channel domain-containing protein [Steroidobacteraceae bacterium]
MSDNAGAIRAFLATATDGETLLQVAAIGLAILGAILCQHRLQGTEPPAGLSAPRGVRARIVEIALIEAPFVLALVLLLLLRTVIAAVGAVTGVLDTAMELAATLIVVRFVMYLLRLGLGPDSWMRTWERRLTLLIWLGISFQIIGWFGALQNTLNDINLLPGRGQFTLWALLKGLVIISAFVLVTSVLARAIERRIMTVESIALSTRIGINKFSYFFLVGLGVLLGINAAGVDLTALTVLTGAVGLGLGFGLQSIASNFVSGFVLLMDKSIKPGDVISFTGMPGTSTESFGWVQALRGRYVVVRDRDGVETLVPNQSLITNPVINWSYSDRKVRLKLPVRISYRDDPERALELLLRAAEGHTRILHEPAPVSRLMQFSDHGMDLELRFWIADPEGGVNNVRSDVNRLIWRLFRDAQVTIPAAQREILLRREDPPGAAAPGAAAPP